MRMFHSTWSEEWPSGKAWQVIKKLNKNFCPTDSIASLETETDLASIKMKMRYSNAISDLQVLNAIIIQYRKERQWPCPAPLPKTF